jgi:PAS domain S-box-containing protein
MALPHIAEGSVQIGAVLAIDVSGQLTYVNRHAEALTGRSRSELLGKPLSSLFRQSQHARRQGVCGISLQAMEESRRLGPANDWVRASQDTDLRVTECYATPIRDRYGLITGAMIVVRAIFDTGVSFLHPANGTEVGS